MIGGGDVCRNETFFLPGLDENVSNGGRFHPEQFAKSA